MTTQDDVAILSHMRSVMGILTIVCKGLVTFLLFQFTIIRQTRAIKYNKQKPSITLSKLQKFLITFLLKKLQP